MSVTVRPTDEKSLSDCAELADMQRMRLAVMDRIGNSWAFSYEKMSGVSAAAGTFIALYFAISCCLEAMWARSCSDAGEDAQVSKWVQSQLFQLNSATGTYFYISSLYTENDLYCPRNRDRLKGRHLTDRCCCWATEANCLIILWSIEPTTSRLHWRARTAQKDVGRIGHKAGRESQAWLFV